MVDSRGEFEIPGLPAGVLVLRAEAPGYVPELVDVDAECFEVDTSLTAAPIVIRLTARAAPVTVGTGGGTITTPAGIELVAPAGRSASVGALKG